MNQHAMNQLLLVTAFAFVCSLSIADQPAAADAPEAEDSQGRIVLEEPATTVKEALERRSEQESAAAAELEAARKAYEERLAATNQRTIHHLEVIARRAVADGQLVDAANAYEEILRLDSENEPAKEFFQTLGRLDEVQKRLAKIPGDDRRVWRREGRGRHSFVLQPDGNWKEFSSNGRLHAIWKEASRDEYVIELHRSGGESVRLHRSRYYYTTDGNNWKGDAKGQFE